MRHESAFERFASDVSDVAVSETACGMCCLFSCDVSISKGYCGLCNVNCRLTSPRLFN